MSQKMPSKEDREEACLKVNGIFVWICIEILILTVCLCFAVYEFTANASDLESLFRSLVFCLTVRIEFAVVASFERF